MYTCAYFLHLIEFELEQTWVNLESITSHVFQLDFKTFKFQVEFDEVSSFFKPNTLYNHCKWDLKEPQEIILSISHTSGRISFSNVISDRC